MILHIAAACRHMPQRFLLPEAFTEYADPVPAHDLLDLSGAECGSLESRLDGEHAASVVQVRNDHVPRGAIEAGHAALAHVQPPRCVDSWDPWLASMKTGASPVVPFVYAAIRWRKLQQPEMLSLNRS
jgi:hypothetical protein